MKKILIYIFVILMLFFTACSNNELPPEPGAPGEGTTDADLKTGGAIKYVPQGYAPPNDIFDNDKQIFFLDQYIVNIDPEEPGFTLSSKVEHEGAYVYKYGYIWKESRWEQYEFPQETVSGSNWIKQDAKTDIKVSKYDVMPGENYIVSYSCKKQNGDWKCGCRSDYDCGYWMLNTFIYRQVDLPPEPEEPGSPTTMRIYIDPRNQIVEKDNELDLYMGVETSWDMSQEMPDDVTLTLSKPDNTEERVTLERHGDVYCYTDAEDVRFSCYTGFSAQYTPTSLGEYELKLYEDENYLPDYLKIYQGSFKVYSTDKLDHLLIRENIGDYQYNSHNNYFGWYSDYYGDSFYVYYYKDSASNNLNIYTGKNSKRIYFDDWMKYSQDEINEVVLNVDDVDHTIYVMEHFYSDEEEESVVTIHKSADIRWASGNTVVSIYAWAWDIPYDYEAVATEYLRKYPTIIDRKPCEGAELTDTLEVGQTKTYAVNGMDYEVTVMIVSGDVSSDAVAKLIINGEVTKALSAGDIYLLADGAAIGIRHVLPTKSGDVVQNLVEFCLYGKEDLACKGSDFQDTLEVGESEFYSAKGKDYEVTVVISDGLEVKLIVNGEVTNSLAEGEDYYLADGSLLKVNDVAMSNNTGDPVNIANFCVFVEEIDICEGADVSTTMEVGQTETFTINDVDYEVTIMIVSGDTSTDAITKLIINDEVTKSLEAGQKYTLADGAELKIKEVLPTKSGDIVENLVEFCLTGVVDEVVIPEEGTSGSGGGSSSSS